MRARVLVRVGVVSGRRETERRKIQRWQIDRVVIHNAHAARHVPLTIHPQPCYFRLRAVCAGAFSVERVEYAWHRVGKFASQGENGSLTIPCRVLAFKRCKRAKEIVKAK